MTTAPGSRKMGGAKSRTFWIQRLPSKNECDQVKTKGGISKHQRAAPNGPAAGLFVWQERVARLHGITDERQSAVVASSHRDETEGACKKYERLSCPRWRDC